MGETGGGGAAGVEGGGQGGAPEASQAGGVHPPRSLSEAALARTWVVHLETGTVGRMARYWTGLPSDMYRSPINGEVMLCPVLQLDTGDAFVVRGPDTFVPLTGAEIAVYESYAQMVTQASVIVARTAAAAKVPMEMFRMLGASVLKLQERALSAEHPEPPPGADHG